jgi:Peptidase family M28
MSWRHTRLAPGLTYGLALALLFFLGCSDDDGAVDPDAAMDAGTADASVVPDGGFTLVLPDLDMAAAEVDLEYLSSTACAGRAPCTAGNALAMDYVEARFIEIGLEPAGDTPGSYRQAVPYTQFEQTAVPEVTLDGSALVSGDDFTVFFYSSPGQVSAEVVFAGYGVVIPPFDPAQYPNCPFAPAGYDDFAGLDLTGRIALYATGWIEDASQIAANDCPFEENGSILASAVIRGASGILLVRDNHYPPEIIRGFLASPDTGTDGLPMLAMHRGRLAQALPDLSAWIDTIGSTLTSQSRHTGIQMSIHVQAQNVETETYNLLGRIPGTDPDLGEQVIILSGHIDHLGVDEETGAVYAGTNDNASGTVGAYRLAEALLTLDTPPRRTVLVAAWNAEETGLWGSCHYAGSVLYDPLRTVAVLNLEMFSSGDGDRLMIRGEESDLTNGWLTRLLKSGVAALNVPVEIVELPMYWDSDHWCFYQQGMSAVTVLGGQPGYVSSYHLPADNMTNFSMAEMEKGLLASWSLLLPLVMGMEHDLPSPPPSLLLPRIATPSIHAPMPWLGPARRIWTY